MAQLIPLGTDDRGTILIEVSGPAAVAGRSAIDEASAGKSAADKAIDAASGLSGTIPSLCARIAAGFQAMDAGRRPAKATVEFGLSVSVEGTVYVVKGSGEATIKVTAEWDLTP